MKEWTDLHRREARIAYALLWVERVATGARIDAIDLPPGYFASEDVFRRVMHSKLFDEQTIERTVRRVRGLAEGRLVRETSEGWGVARTFPNEYGRWLVRPEPSATRDDARRAVGEDRDGYYPVLLRTRAIRIRRRSRP